MRSVGRLGIYALPLLVSSCGMFEPEPPQKAQIVMYEWEDTGGDAPLSIEINLKQQKASYRRGGREIGWSYVSTGRPGNPTPVGDFRVTEKLPMKVSSRYGWIADSEGKLAIPDVTPKTPVPPGHSYNGAEMHQWMRLTSYGIGLHAGEIAKPGEARSRGCIRLPRDFSPTLYKAVTVGTPVRIVRG